MTEKKEKRETATTFFTKIKEASSKLQEKVWANDAYLSYIKSESDKVKMENVYKERNVKMYNQQNEKLKNETENLCQIKERIVNTYQTISSNLINLKLYEKQLKNEYKNDTNKIDVALTKYREEYEVYKNQLERNDPLYKELEEARIKFKKTQFYYKYFEQELKNYKEMLKLKNNIKTLMFNKCIVNFVKIVKEYQDKNKMYETIRKLEDEEAKLLDLYEKKLKEKNKKKHIIDLGLNEFQLISTELQFPVNLAKTTVKVQPMPCKTPTIPAYITINCKTAEQKIKDHDVRMNDIKRKLKELENEETKSHTPKMAKINVISVEPVNDDLKNKMKEFLAPQPPKKMKVSKSVEFRDDLTEIITSPQPAKYLQTGVSQIMSELEIKSQNDLIDAKNELINQKKIKEVNAKMNVSQEFKTPPDVNMSRINEMNNSQSLLVNEEHSQINYNKDENQSNSKSSQESTFSQKMARWQNVSGLELYNMYNLSSNEPEIIEKPDQLSNLLSDSRDAQSYFHTALISPPRTSPMMSESFKQYEIEEPSTTNNELNLFKFESGNNTNNTKKQSFGFKDMQTFNMF